MEKLYCYPRDITFLDECIRRVETLQEAYLRICTVYALVEFFTPSRGAKALRHDLLRSLAYDRAASIITRARAITRGKLRGRGSGYTSEKWSAVHREGYVVRSSMHKTFLIPAVDTYVRLFLLLCEPAHSY